VIGYTASRSSAIDWLEPGCSEAPSLNLIRIA